MNQNTYADLATLPKVTPKRLWPRPQDPWGEAQQLDNLWGEQKVIDPWSDNTAHQNGPNNTPPLNKMLHPGRKRYLKLLHKIEIGEDLTQAEPFSFMAMEKVHAKKHLSSASNMVSISMYSILAWAGVSPSNIAKFHEDTHRIWRNIDNETKPNSKVIMMQHFKELMSDNTMFQLCCHAKLATTMVNVQFKPGGMNAAKPHLGIGILAFVVRQMSEFVFLTEQGDLMSRSSFRTTADSQKLKLGAQKLPVTIDPSTQSSAAEISMRGS